LLVVEEEIHKKVLQSLEQVVLVVEVLVLVVMVILVVIPSRWV
tara:strand:+ start:279 stop:407 length:129 start_codon:yes stop_codon:yes gene_type:complete